MQEDGHRPKFRGPHTCSESWVPISHGGDLGSAALCHCTRTGCELRGGLYLPAQSRALIWFCTELGRSCWAGLGRCGVTVPLPLNSPSAGRVAPSGLPCRTGLLGLASPFSHLLSLTQKPHLRGVGRPSLRCRSARLPAGSSCSPWCPACPGSRGQRSVQAGSPRSPRSPLALGPSSRHAGLRGAAGAGSSTAERASPRVTGDRNRPRLGARGRAGAGAQGGGMRGRALSAAPPAVPAVGSRRGAGRGGRRGQGACAERGGAEAASGTRPGPADSRRPRGPARPGLARTWAAPPRRARGGSGGRAGGSCRHRCRCCRCSCCCSRRPRHRYGRRWQRGQRGGGTAPGRGQRGGTARREPVLPA